MFLIAQFMGMAVFRYKLSPRVKKLLECRQVEEGIQILCQNASS